MLLVRPEWESWRKLFYPLRVQLAMLLLVILAVVLSGCSPVSPQNDSSTLINTSPQPAAEPEKTSDTAQNKNNLAAPESDELQSARNILFTWHPEWRDLEAQGRRAIEDGFATMTIDAEPQPTGIYIFHVYDIIEYPDESHSATYGWYEINTDTGEIYDNVLNEKVY
ncbi:MAG: hypothetical protein GXY16_03570 [Syntrophomonadaceae bacterium]|nr:hypothetical protein [Syntrophomonadaceae bacterium]